MKKLLSVPVIISVLFLLSSCRKNSSDPKENHVDAKVAVDWYKLQLRILLERNSALNGVYFGYIGIGLYESTYSGFRNAVSLSTKLYQMPTMPAKENYKEYQWEVSANAAMAKMVRSFYTGLTPA